MYNVLFPDDYKGVICVYFDNGRGLVRCLIVAPEEAHIIRSFAHFLRYFFIEMRRGLSADIGGCRDDRSFELCAEGFTEGLGGDPNTDRTIFGNEVLSQMPRIGVNECERLGGLVFTPLQLG